VPNRSTIWRIPTLKKYLFFLFLGIIVTFQWHGNAFRAEFGGTPDEPAHYVTGLLVRDYITSGWPANPLEYARNYYVHYPKLGLGHWPPFFYVVQTAWSLVFTPSRVSMILLMGVLTALTAAIFCNTVREEYPLGAAAVATVFLISLVESRMGASTDAGAPPRFPSPLIKPDVRIARIRLSDWLHRRLTNGPPTELDEPAVLRVRRTPFLLRNGWCRAIAPDGASAGSAVRSHRRSYEPPDTRRPGFHS